MSCIVIGTSFQVSKVRPCMMVGLVERKQILLPLMMLLPLAWSLPVIPFVALAHLFLLFSAIAMEVLDRKHSTPKLPPTLFPRTWGKLQGFAGYRFNLLFTPGIELKARIVWCRVKKEFWWQVEMPSNNPCG